MRETINDQLAAFFRARPNVWISMQELAKIAGTGGWRSRVCDLRESIADGGKYAMTIENRVRSKHLDGCAKLFAADLEERAKCDCRRITISEYRYIPPPPVVDLMDALQKSLDSLKKPVPEPVQEERPQQGHDTNGWGLR